MHTYTHINAYKQVHIYTCTQKSAHMDTHKLSLDTSKNTHISTLRDVTNEVIFHYSSTWLPFAADQVPDFTICPVRVSQKPRSE